MPMSAISSSKELTLALDACAYIDFTTRAINNKTAYTMIAVTQEKNLTIKFI